MSGYVDRCVPFPPRSNGVLLVVVVVLPYAAAQSYSSEHEYPYKNLNVSMMVILAIFLAMFLLISLISVFIRHCFDDSGDWASSNFTLHRPSTPRFSKFHRRGLDSSLLESFPTFSFSEIKDRRIGNAAAVECAVCLNELDDGETLRLLPMCGHVFHRHCIDNWIASHNTCPVCRTDLSKRKQTGEHLVVVESRRTELVGDTENQISITVSNVVVHNNNNNNNNALPEKELRFEKLRRSRSTGHLTGKVNGCVAFSSDDEGRSSERGNRVRPRGEGSNQPRSGGCPFLQKPGSPDAHIIDGNARPPAGLPV